MPRKSASALVDAMDSEYTKFRATTLVPAVGCVLRIPVTATAAVALVLLNEYRVFCEIVLPVALEAT